MTNKYTPLFSYFPAVVLSIILLLLSEVFASSTEHVASDKSQPKGVYFTGVYPDYFAEWLGKSEQEVKVRLDSTFNQLFFGNDSTQRLYYPVAPDMAYIEDITNADVRTEGMSYGMMIAVQMDKKNEFDQLWKWAKIHMQIQNGAHKGYFAWHCKMDGTVLDSTAASDGESWFVTALFFASARWGDGQGIFDYRHEAQEILRTMLHKDSEPDHGLVTNMFNEKEKLVAFVPNVEGSSFTDPSYQLPHYYELWARWSDKDDQFWCDAAAASRELLRKAANPITGLSPDYTRFDGSSNDFWGGHGDFRFDAWRVGMNTAIDYQWFCRDTSEVTDCNRMLGFFYSQGIKTYGNQYTLDGKKLSNDHSAGLVAMNAVAALVSTNDNRKEFVEEFWNTPVPHGFYRYYDGMLYMLGMLQVSGNFRIYDPTGKVIPGCSK